MALIEGAAYSAAISLCYRSLPLHPSRHVLAKVITLQSTGVKKNINRHISV